MIIACVALFAAFANGESLIPQPNTDQNRSDHHG